MSAKVSVGWMEEELVLEAGSGSLQAQSPSPWPRAPLTDPSTHCDSRMAPQHPKKPTVIIRAPAPTST